MNSGAEDYDDLKIGATTDTSNFTSITGMHPITLTEGSSNTPVLISSRPMYRVTANSRVTDSNLFVRGNVTEGDFTVGNAKIEITNTTTINDIIQQINYSEASNATAYWDSVEGNFVIKSKTSGSTLINIESGTSNFTDIMGFTVTSGGASKLDTERQELGLNAKFSINGTDFSSTSNIIGSDVSRIQGVTIDLKDITEEGETVTLTIEKDKEKAADAMLEVVNAYNELIENVDKEIANDGKLNKETTLKMIRNQIRSLMTGSIVTKNLDAVGISLAAATTGNIRTDNINTLSFNKEKFLNAFSTDLNSLKEVLVGDNTKKGILTNVEDLLEQSLAGVTGYFDSATKSYTTKISKLDNKIEKTNTAADRYKVRLENKFQAMDRIISSLQNNYSSFLS